MFCICLEYFIDLYGVVNKCFIVKLEISPSSAVHLQNCSKCIFITIHRFKLFWCFWCWSGKCIMKHWALKFFSDKYTDMPKECWIPLRGDFFLQIFCCCLFIIKSEIVSLYFQRYHSLPLSCLHIRAVIFIFDSSQSSVFESSLNIEMLVGPLK